MSAKRLPSTRLSDTPPHPQSPNSLLPSHSMKAAAAITTALAPTVTPLPAALTSVRLPAPRVVLAVCWARDPALLLALVATAAFVTANEVAATFSEVVAEVAEMSESSLMPLLTAISVAVKEPDMFVKVKREEKARRGVPVESVALRDS